jgi:hypothetical protein
MWMPRRLLRQWLLRRRVLWKRLLRSKLWLPGLVLRGELLLQEEANVLPQQTVSA